jgi:hypothetical protein
MEGMIAGVTVQAALEESKTRPGRQCAKAGRVYPVSFALVTCDAEECSRKPLLVPFHRGRVVLACWLAPAPVSDMSELHATPLIGRRTALTDRTDGPHRRTAPTDRTDRGRRLAVNPQ